MFVKVVRRAGVEAAVRQIRKERAALWEPHAGAKRFLRRFCPSEWEEVRRCGFDVKKQEDANDPGRIKLTPFSCWRTPWCFVCSDLERRRAALAVLKRMEKCTPPGKEPGGWHVVQHAPFYQDGGGWGVQAAKDPKLFRKVVFNVFAKSYGAGIGAHLTYHHFGEAGPPKIGSHIDATINAWELVVPPRKLEPYDLKRGGYDRWQQALMEEATVFDLDAREGNLDIRRIVGRVNLYRVLKYQLRELLDVRKIDYEPAKQKIWWISYRDNRRTPYDPGRFLAAVREYLALKERIGTFSAGYGYLAKGASRTAARSFGGKEQKHPKRCLCGVCNDWVRVYMPEVEEALGPGRGVDARARGH